MFQVVNVGGHILTVYAVAGSLFLIWNDSTEDAHWEWVSMDRFRPLGPDEGENTITEKKIDGFASN